MLCKSDIQEWQISKFYKQKDYDDDCYNILLNTNSIYLVCFTWLLSLGLNDINGDFIKMLVRHLN